MSGVEAVPRSRFSNPMRTIAEHAPAMLSI
jgi:hypothetical protein